MRADRDIGVEIIVARRRAGLATQARDLWPPLVMLGHVEPGVLSPDVLPYRPGPLSAADIDRLVWMRHLGVIVVCAN